MLSVTLRHRDRIMAKPKLKRAQPPEIHLVDTKPERWTPPPPLKPLTRAQGLFLSSLRTNTLSIAVGSAGTGKTMLAAAFAADRLQAGDIDKIILTRPIVESEEHLGFLPGGVNEKVLPYILPVRSIFYERMGKSFTDYCLKTEKIEVVPLAYMRGHTFKDSVVLFDEAQNCTPKQMLLFLSRLGHGVTVAVTGDTRQSDLAGCSGLEDAVARLEGLPGVGVTRFDRGDVVRSGFCQQVLGRYGE